MSEMDDYYRLLGLNPGASEEEIKEAYKDLIKVWHPDRFSNDPRLKEKASEKLREINLAYEVLKTYIAGKSEQSTASRERRNHAESQSPPREPSPKPDQEQTTAGVEGNGGFQPPPGQPFGQPPPHVNPTKQEKQTISHSPLMWFFMMFGAGIGYVITKQTHFSTSNEAGFYVGGICALLGGIGGLIGIGIVKIINGMEKPRKHKVRLAWAAAVAGGLLFSLTFASIPSPSSKHGQPRTSSSVNPSSTTPSEESTSKESPFLAYIRKKERHELNVVPKDVIWKLMAKDSQGTTFSYDTKYIVRLEIGVGVWTKTVYGDKAIPPEIGQFGKDHERVTSSLEANQIDCVSSMACRIRVFHYSKEGLCLGYSDTPSEWISIPPNSVLAVLQKEVCR